MHAVLSCVRAGLLIHVHARMPPAVARMPAPHAMALVLHVAMAAACLLLTMLMAVSGRPTHLAAVSRAGQCQRWHDSSYREGA
jgi:hypothetical protein